MCICVDLFHYIKCDLVSGGSSCGPLLLGVVLGWIGLKIWVHGREDSVGIR